jgi:carbon starvation protein
MLLCPRDYLSSFMKVGTILFLALGVILVNPQLHMPAVTQYASGGGRSCPDPLFPFLFITIACGAISGFHALVASARRPRCSTRKPTRA